MKKELPVAIKMMIQQNPKSMFTYLLAEQVGGLNGQRGYSLRKNVFGKRIPKIFFLRI